MGMWPQLINLCNFGPGMAALQWWQTAGINPIAVYQAKGAASYAASKINLVTPGTYNLTETNGVVPWDSVNGWKFAEADTKAFTTGIIPPNTQNCSILVQFSNGSGTGFLISSRTGADELGIRPNAGTGFGWFMNGNFVNATLTTTGNMAIAGNQGYLNGLANGGAIGVWGGVSTTQINIARRSLVAQFVTANIKAIVYYDTTLTATQIATMTTRMAAL